GDRLVGEVSGAPVIILDDLIGTGTTLVRAAAACRAAGATRVYAAATHGIFVGGAPKLWGGELDAVIVTDTVPPFRADPSAAGRLTLLDATPLVAATIRRLHDGDTAAAA